MAARARSIPIITLSGALVVWVWALAGVLFALRWTAIERPGPPLKAIFPYGEMRVGVDASYPPFAVATTDDLYGLEIDLGRAIAERLGAPVRFVNMGFDGLYDSLRADLVDVVISTLLIDPARMNDVLYTIPYYNAGMVLVSRAESGITTMADMSGRALAYEFGSEGDAVARRWLRRIAPFQPQPYELPGDALEAARLELADAVLVDATSAYLYLRDHPEWLAEPHYVTDALYAIATRLDRGTTWDAVNRALIGLADDGTLQSIVERWL